jgi:predicted dehydrogenase
MDRKFAVIGAGQLGSRHLQALGRVGGRNDIFIVDPNADSRRVARERFNEFNPGFLGKLYELESLLELPAELDVAIVATTSNVRLAVLATLMKSSKVRYLLLEKVLFQDLAQYQQAAELLQMQIGRVWVNCP